MCVNSKFECRHLLRLAQWDIACGILPGTVSCNSQILCKTYWIVFQLGFTRIKVVNIFVSSFGICGHKPDAGHRGTNISGRHNVEVNTACYEGTGVMIHGSCAVGVNPASGKHWDAMWAATNESFCELNRGNASDDAGIRTDVDQL